MKQILCIAWVFIALSNGYLLAQDCECDKNYEKIFVDQKDQLMNGMYHDDKQLGGHPYNTFSRTHTTAYVKGTTNAKERLDNLRAIVQNFQKLNIDVDTSVFEAQKSI